MGRFVCKIGNDGEPAWLKQIGRDGSDEAVAMSLVNSYLYVAGCYKSSPCVFDNGHSLTNDELNYDVYLAKYNGQGSLLWAKGKGGPGLDDGFAVSCYGDFVGIGRLFSSTVVFGQDILQSGSTVESNAYFATFSLDGNEIGARVIFGNAEETCRALVFDNEGAIIIGGHSESSPLIIGSLTYTISSGCDGFIIKYQEPFSAATIL